VTIKLSKADIQTIGTHGENTYPEECCGIIIGYSGSDGKVVVELVPTQNAWDAAAEPASEVAPKRRRYAIAPEDLLQAQKQARLKQLEIIGIYHSHPDYPATPSQFDRNLAWSGYSYLIASIDRGSASDIKSWCLDDKGDFQPEPILIADA
jgi:proteasome lid subunit RPN8/RPN11